MDNVEFSQPDMSNIDFLSMSAHKIFGLKGIGLLIKKEKISIDNLIHGGKSTTIYRSGTPVTANVIALEKAFELATTKLNERSSYIKKLNDILRNEFSKIDCIHINSPSSSIPNTLNISLINKNTKAILKALEEHEIYLSTTTACSLGTAPSKSVLAITGSEQLAANTIRISISHLTKEEDINTFLKIFKDLLHE